MKKLLFLINNLGGGGAEKVLVTLINVIGSDYDITVQTIYNEGYYFKQLSQNISYKTIVRKPTLNKKRIMNRLIKYLPAGFLHWLFVKGKYDVEVGFLEGPSCKIISGANQNTKTIGWIHIDIHQLTLKESGFRSRKDETTCYNALSRIVCVSQDAKQAFITRTNSKNEPLVIYNPIDKKSILEQSMQDCEGLCRKRFTLCGVGRLTNQKGFDRLIDTVYKLRQEGYDFDLWILGEGELKAALLKQIQNLGLQDSVTLLGFSKNPYAIMRLCDLYVCSSRNEGYSLTVAEALVLGIPVISTATTGPLELLDNGKYGMIVDNSTEGLYTGVKSVLDNNDLLSALKTKAIRRSDFFNIENTIKATRKLLNE